MYRDDECAVCGESLPPDHFYCREHAVDVDERLHTIGQALPALESDARSLHSLVKGIAQETWDYLADSDPEEPDWPPTLSLNMQLDAESISLDVDQEPGYVRMQLDVTLLQLLELAGQGLGQAASSTFVDTVSSASGTGVTH